MKIQDYFTPVKWKKLIDYEKIRLSNTYDKYRKMRELGFDPIPPDFVVAYERRKRKNTNRRNSDRDLLPAKRLLLNEETDIQVAEHPRRTSADVSHTSGKLYSAKKFSTEIFTLDDDSKRVTRSKWKNRNDPETSRIENSRYSMRTSARNKKYRYHSSTEEEDID